MVSTLVADILGWLFFVGITILGLTIMVLGTIQAYRGMQARHHSEAISGVVATGSAIVLFLGGWLPLALYWLARWMWRMTRHSHSDQFQGNG